MKCVEQVRTVLVVVFSLIAALPLALHAQGPTTAAVRGTIHASDGTRINSAIVRVINTSNGHTSETRASDGRFVIQGLEPGGPFRVVVRHIGYLPASLTGLSLTLGEIREINFTLLSSPGQLDTVRVTASNGQMRTSRNTGVSTLISDSSLRRLPTLNRDMYDFVRLVPQAGTRLGLTGGAASFRYNSYLIDGTSDRQLQGNNVLGTASVGGKTISLDAVREYQVLLSPYNARYGDFAGMLVNAVTKSGTNDLHGSAYTYVRNEQLARRNSFVGSSPYRRQQYGISLGGPLLRDRLHFFIAPEFQSSSTPIPGPYVGQASDAVPRLPVSADSIARFASLLRAKGLDPGDGGRVIALNPVTTLFGRLDLAVPEWKSRVVFLENYSSVEATRFPNRDIAIAQSFPLSSNEWTLVTEKRSTAVQIYTQGSSRVFNELMLAYMNRPVAATRYTLSPSIQVSVKPDSGGATVPLIAGPPPPAGGASSSQILGEIGDYITFQAGSRHTLGAGIHVELFDYHTEGVRGNLGQWTFSTLNALASGDAALYMLSRDFGSAESSVRGIQPSVYASDEWKVNDRLSLTLGLRSDVLDYSSRPRYNASVDSVFGRNTSDYPRARFEWSPRFGFAWTPAGDRATEMRGGFGVFAGPPPLGWMVGPVRSTGAGVRSIRCSGPGKVPKFVADPANQPQICPDGTGFTDGPVALVDRDLRMARSFRSSLALDRRIFWNFDAGVDFLYSRVLSDYLFINANLVGPQSLDAHGRVLYGKFDSNGRSTPTLVANNRYPEVIDLRNHSLGYSWSGTMQIEKQFRDHLGMRASYTYSRSRDVQSLTNTSALAPFDIWASARQLSGLHDKLSTGISAFEIPHRVILLATYAAPWKRWKTDLSLYYIGESGSPFTFGDSTSDRRGDLNADGTSANDPIYVPLNATDQREIVFDGPNSAAQGVAFEQFIRSTPCLRRQRGRIVARNSCSGPWQNTSNASVRQSIQTIRGHDLSLQVEVFNLLNMLDSSWGLYRQPNAWILQHVGQTDGNPSQPVFHYDTSKPSTTTQNLESGYQLQLSLRYSF